MRADDIATTKILSNGAVLKRISYDCEVCVKRGEQPECSVFAIEYKGQQVLTCLAHAQQLIDWDADKQGNIFDELFEMPEV